MQIYAINTNKRSPSQNLKTICHSKVTFACHPPPSLLFFFVHQLLSSRVYVCMQGQKQKKTKSKKQWQVQKWNKKPWRMNPLKPMIMKMPSQCLRVGVKCGGGSQVGGRMTAAVTTTRACRKHCQKSKSLKIKSNLFAKTPKTLGGCMDCGSGGGMVGSGVRTNWNVKLMPSGMKTTTN